ncbi:TPA: helix-turn-helix transcriptional regulator [Staphylococcus aureus]|uniref:helix-turn-helix domain-containing protein n=1 Tax=Staphylococcus aureus TaxID=1280 RepID=UPI0007CA26C5|nr:helix-turn-helix transcriptional regulator [Staphylococcus aureus]AUJ55009.1 transcriptional regulator [Staphylococcus aureus]AUJ57663.1 transcriptional regulator [Staphylococcus aureus]AUW98544.1 transcriptional regulator [Staphylococcus aureus]MBU6082737.1 helix-turn-helix domain-containing protein [Staphylococcus aureus]MBU6084874.1 helix-turn-helix domain-containing protein [Staphylococcus aureus]
MTTTEKEKLKLTIGQWRALKGMSKAELSRKSGVTEKTIYNYESSQEYIKNSNFKTLNKLAIGLGITVDNIFLGSDSEKPKF